MKKSTPCLCALTLATLSVLPSCGLIPPTPQIDTVPEAKRNQVIGALPRGYAALAIHEQLSASMDKRFVRSGPRMIRVDAGSQEAFGDLVALQEIVRVAMQEAELNQYVRIPGRRRGRLPARIPARTVQIAGFHGRSQVYWGAASNANEWQLNTRFSVAAAVDELQSVPGSLSGLAELVQLRSKTRRTMRGRLPSYERALADRAREMLGKVEEDFESQLRQLGEVQELAAIRREEMRAQQTLQQVGLTNAGSGFKKIADSEMERRAAKQLRVAEQQLREQPANDLFATLNLGAKVRGLHQSLLRYGAKQSAQDLEQLTFEEIERRLEGSAVQASFANQLKAYEAKPSSLPVLLATGKDLESLTASQPALAPYVDGVTGRIGEVLDACLLADLGGIKGAGTTVFDAPGLLTEIDELAAWYSEWGADDLADEVQKAGLARIAALAEQGYASYAKEVEQRAVNRASTRQLETELGFFRDYAEVIHNSIDYAKVSSAAIDRMEAQLSVGILQRLRLPTESQGLGVSVAGHLMDVGTFAENLAEAGHELTGATTEPGDANTARLSSLTIATADGAVVVISGGPATEEETHFTGNRLKMDGNEGELFPSEWVDLMLQLRAVAPSGVLDAAGLADSDRFASDPLDPKKLVEQGTFAEELVHDVALEAALLAIEKNPAEPRFYYHAGRTLLAMGEVAEAQTFLERAHADGYPAAAFALGALVVQSIMTLGENEMPKISELRKAKKLFDAASASGYTVAADQSAMVSELMAGMTPKFAEGFKKPDLIEAVYMGKIDRLLRAPERARRNYLYYFSSLRAAVAAKHKGFERSSLNRDINSFAPQVHKDAQKVGEAVAGGGLKDWLEGMKQYQEMGLRALNDRDVWQVDRSYPQGADWDGMLLMMYVGHDDEELDRVFGSVLEYLRRAKK